MTTTSISSQFSTRSGGSTELCGASQVLNFTGGSPSTTSTSSEDRRNRSNRGSSDDKELQAWGGFVNEDWRAGSPFLCTVPVVSHDVPPSHPFYDPLGVLNDRNDHIYQGVDSILTAANVKINFIHFCGRQSKFEPEAQLTLTALIGATKRNVEENWLAMSRAVHEFLQSQGTSGISVKIFDGREFARDRYQPIVSSDAIFRKWDSVLDTILQTCNLVNWNSVGCYRIGTEDDWRMNPPTVIVTVNTSLPDWRPTREKIVSILNSFDLPMVGVKIKRDNIIVGTSKDDSGALVFNRGCRVVGMAIAGSEMEPYTFITHIDDLFSDIKASTGAAMVRLQGN